MSEFEQQRDLFSWIRRHVAQHPDLAKVFAIPNGGHRSKAAAGKAKAEGATAGVWDVCCPCPRNGNSGLWVEMKFGKGRLSPEQREWHRLMNGEGWKLEVHYEWTEAARAIFGYLGLPCSL